MASKQEVPPTDVPENRSPAMADASEGLPEGAGKQFHELVETIKMKHHLTSKLTLKDILSIGIEDLLERRAEKAEDLPWDYLRKLMVLNRTARDGLLTEQCTDDDQEELFNVSFTESVGNSLSSIHPLDVLCVLLHCTDSFLCQEILTKMSMCQFAVPLLLPAGDGLHCNLLLWAIRDIVKKWRPQTLAGSKGFREDNVDKISMPFFSFVRMGENKLSKSKILNQILNPSQFHNNFFIHDNMNGGNLTRKISDGLVELSWYFPLGKSDMFPEPIAVTNLRGDLSSHLDQFLFLTRISSAVFIFVESISSREFALLSTHSNKDTQYFFILSPGPGNQVNTETLKTLQELSPILKLKKSNVIVYSGGTNKAAFTVKIQSSIANCINHNIKRIKMREFESKINGLKIDIDERTPDCQKAKVLALNITEEIKDVFEYKQKSMVLQGELWKQLSQIEKERCRMTKQGCKDAQQYLDELKNNYYSLHKKQNAHDLPRGIMLFIDALSHLNMSEKHFFLKWLKFELDSIARNNLSMLQSVYKEKCNVKSCNTEELKQIDQKISDSSLGIEHFLREMGQFYEAECSMIKENKLDEVRKQFTGLPGIAADLLLEGFPLELIDGDASNIPLQWILAVLTELNNKTGNECRMRVITVLGAQSTGKSTLLNTMFGLQFPVASGRCTRGAFMTLLNVRENLQNELGCQFIMVIDTEGLKAPELASLEGSYEHDNELATLVVGLSDITIVNMAMENATEMKDILQIVVHAFLRMKEVGKRPNCQFVHQNVSDVSAHDKNMRDRKKLLEQLNEITKIAAEMEKKTEIKEFCDVMDYNLEKDNWYIPGLWLGVPPMAPVNSGYSEQVHELKKYLLEFMKSKSLKRPLTILEFTTWIESLWNAVKHEKFIFSFRNSLMADAYNKLCMVYSQWEWEFRKAVHSWLINTETNIKNQSAESMNEDLLCSEYRSELCILLSQEKNKMIELLDEYFDNKSENVHLLERYKLDFILSAEFLRRDLERNALNKCDEGIAIQKGKFKIQSIQNSSQKLIEDKISDLLSRCRERNQKLSDSELEKEFDDMWENTLTNLQLEKLKRRTVSKCMLQQLINDMSNKGSAINQALGEMKDLQDCTQINIGNDGKKESGLVERFKNFITSVLGPGKKESHEKIKDFAFSLMGKCEFYIQEKVSTAEDYDDTYCQELLHMINTEISNQPKNCRLSSQLELSIKHHILGKASTEFQKMHDAFIAKNDPKLSLNRLKPEYLGTFICTFLQKDVCQTKAKQFCEQCLKPALIDAVFKHLGNKIVDDIKHSSDNKRFCSRTYFQSFLLRELLEELSFPKYAEYIESYEAFTRRWIGNYIENKYANPKSLKSLEEDILSLMNKRVMEVLADKKCLRVPSVSDFLKQFCEMLKNELVIPSNEMNVVSFQNNAQVDQFSLDIQLFLKEQTMLQISLQLKSMDIKSVLSQVSVNPQEELFRQVVGCGKLCPFCNVPCEGGGLEHTQHFASIHRPGGLGTYRWKDDETLSTEICSTSIVSSCEFRNSDTQGKYFLYKHYRKLYPDWDIKPDPSIQSSDYWKYIFSQFNEEFAKAYHANPAKLPQGWKSITKQQALQSLQEACNDNY
ncbi:up-regulator of cell proliferation-like [Hyperolius riggenbachi]|uniref:up-regulator of cell proliferation-like n=1 Tax=Hyperolius riggenbachi TaxID=752182 RepID=UPI0035A26CF9